MDDDGNAIETFTEGSYTNTENCETLCEFLVAAGTIDSCQDSLGNDLYIIACPAGFYCGAGSTSTYSLGANNVAQPCEAGYKCLGTRA